jgi:hypothetical protein
MRPARKSKAQSGRIANSFIISFSLRITSARFEFERLVLMLIVHRGAGMLAPLFGLFFALLANVLTYRTLGYSYYDEHQWPKFSVLMMSGFACFFTGMLLKRKRKRDAPREEAAIAARHPNSEVAKIAYSGPRDHLMFIPLQYWSIAYFIGALVYLWQSQ